MEEAPFKRYFTEEEYLLIDRKAEARSEFHDGEIYAMATSGSIHGIISENLSGILYPVLKKKSCQAFSRYMRLSIPQKTAYTFPDFMIVRKTANWRALMDTDIISSPIIIVEILSKNTRGYDRGKKFELYKSIRSLKQYVLIDSTKNHSVESFNKNDRGIWEQILYSQAAEELQFPAINCCFSLAELYDGTF